MSTASAAWKISVALKLIPRIVDAGAKLLAAPAIRTGDVTGEMSDNTGRPRGEDESSSASCNTFVRWTRDTAEAVVAAAADAAAAADTLGRSEIPVILTLLPVEARAGSRSAVAEIDFPDRRGDSLRAIGDKLCAKSFEVNLSFGERLFAALRLSCKVDSVALEGSSDCRWL